MRDVKAGKGQAEMGVLGIIFYSFRLRCEKTLQFSAPASILGAATPENPKLRKRITLVNWYYADQGQQVGPVTETELVQLFQSGKVTLDTLVWREGMADWAPYKQAGPAGEQAGGNPLKLESQPANASVACAQCGLPFDPSEMIRLENSWVCAKCKPIVLQRIREGVGLPGTLQYAGFWVRFAAKFVDGLVIGLPYYILIAFTGPLPGKAQGANSSAMLLLYGMQALLFILGMGYSTFMVGKYGATLGKMACKLRVVQADGSPVSYARAFGRYFADLLSAILCYAGYIMAGFDSEKRALHDRICNTRVIRIQ